MARGFSYALLFVYSVSILSVFAPQLSLVLNYEQVMSEYCIYNDILLEKCDGTCYQKHLTASQDRHNPSKENKVPGKNIPVPAHLKSADTRSDCPVSISAISRPANVNRFSGPLLSKISPPPETGII